MAKGDKGITVKRDENFSEWYSQVVQKAELADLRYNIKGFLVFQPWSVLSMEKMYSHLQTALQRKGHKPYFYPTLIPESNLVKEASHLSGFTPEVFWVTHGGNKKFEEKYALRPTSETAFYQMFALWLRSYKDLPFKTYQRANVFRYETKATRPFLRSREFHWIETHCAFSTEKDALNQVKEDMETTKEVLHDIFGLPFIFFERPAWDKFPGASRTFAADVLNPDGKFVQQPSTHMISPQFSKAFDVKFKDKDEKEKFAHLTCYGPAVSRIFASVIIVHGDDKGLKFPWEIAPIQVVIVPIKDDKKLLKKAEELRKNIQNIASVEVDTTEKSPGEKFNLWEMKGVPIRIDLGFKDLEKKQLTVFRRDLDKKEFIKENDLIKYIEKVAKESTKNLIKKADSLFKGRIKDSKSEKEIKKVIEAGGIARCGFCSVEKEGTKCAEAIEKKTGAEVRGTKFPKEKASGKCAVCGKKANEVVYIGKAY
ncbi:proline--tRNA ligase [Nanoarchaeota archaeon]